jgi:hypothetical protein
MDLFVRREFPLSPSPINTIDVKDETDVTIAQDSAAGETGDILEGLSQALDHHLLLAEKIVDQETKLASL